MIQKETKYIEKSEQIKSASMLSTMILIIMINLVNMLTPISYMNSSKPSLVSIWKLPSISSGTAISLLVLILASFQI